MFFREPIVPVIKKFWYNPDSGINIFSLFLKSYPINKDNLDLSYFIELIFLSFLLFDDVELNNLEIFEYKKLFTIILVIINVIIYVIFIYFHKSGFFEQISKGLIP